MIKFNKVYINSIIIGLLFTTSIITKLITKFISFNNNIVVILLLFLLIINLLNNFKLTKSFLFISFYVLIYYMYSLIKLNVDYNTVYKFSYFIIFGLIPMYIFQFKYDREIMFCTINLVAFFYSVLLFFSVIPSFRTLLIDIDQSMDYSYTCLIGVFSGVISLLFFQISKKNTLISILNILISLYFMLFVSSNRGSLLALMIFMVLCVFLKIKKRNQIFLLISVLFLVFFVVKNIIPILREVSFLLSNLGISSSSLEKTLFNLDNGFELFSGRNILYIASKELIKTIPFIGGGIGYFSMKTGDSYPHNIFYDIILDMGYLTMLVVIVAILYAIIYILQKRNMKYEMIFLFCLSIPRLLVSSTIWENLYFWCLIYLLLSIILKEHIRR